KSLVVQESIPSVFNVTTDASVQNVGDTKIITWNKDLVGNNTYVQYSYSVPLEFPRLYALGPVKIAYEGNKTFTEARPWFVANDPAPTTLYLRSTTTNYAPPQSERSTALPVGTFKGNSRTGFEDLSLSSVKGSAQTSKAIASLAQTAPQDEYVARFTSPPLAAQTISANTWTLAVATAESSTSANSFFVGSIYVWRPSTSSVVGYIYDKAVQRGNEFATSETGIVYSLAGSAVTTNDGDVLVIEFWVDAVQGTATSRTNTLYFEGTTAPTNGTNPVTAASYLQTPQSLTYSVSIIESISLANYVIDNTQIAYVPITLTNNQNSASPAPFQQQITFNPSLYTSSEATNLRNIRFCIDKRTNTPLNAWLENCTPSCINAATSSTVWVKLTSAIAAHGTQTIYLAFLSTGTNFDTLFWGENPKKSGSYGQYDNGVNVFTFYDNLAGTSLN